MKKFYIIVVLLAIVLFTVGCSKRSSQNPADAERNRPSADNNQTVNTPADARGNFANAGMSDAKWVEMTAQMGCLAQSGKIGGLNVIDTFFKSFHVSQDEYYAYNNQIVSRLDVTRMAERMQARLQELNRAGQCGSSN